MEEDRRIPLFQTMPLFGGVGADTLRFLLDIAPVRERCRGQYFYQEGDTADSMFVLLCGHAKMLKTWNGAGYEIKRLVPGDTFGEVALIDLNPRNTSVLALDDCSAMELSAADLYRLYERDLEQFTLIFMNMAREVCRRLRDADRRIFETGMESRLASKRG